MHVDDRFNPFHSSVYIFELPKKRKIIEKQFGVQRSHIEKIYSTKFRAKYYLYLRMIVPNQDDYSQCRVISYEAILVDNMMKSFQGQRVNYRDQEGVRKIFASSFEVGEVRGKQGEVERGFRFARSASFEWKNARANRGTWIFN